MNNKMKLGAALWLSAFLAVACSDAEPVKTDKNGNGVNTSEASCCLNGSFYDCNGDADAATACFNNFDPGSCERDEGSDDACSSGEGEGEGEGEDDFDF